MALDNETLARALLCRGHNDIYEDLARQLIYRNCKPWLEEKRVCVAELLYSSNLQNIFVSSGAFYSSTVQRVAIAQMEALKRPAQERVKELYGFCDTIQLLTRQDIYNGQKPPALENGQFFEFVEAIQKTADPSYFSLAVNKGITQYLSTFKTTVEKVLALVDMLDTSPNNPLNRYLDMFIGDHLMTAATLKEFIGESSENFHDRLLDLIAIYKGQYNHPNHPASAKLSQCLNSSEMPNTKATLAEHMKNALEQNVFLRDGTLIAEFDALTFMMERLRLNNTYIGGDDVLEIITGRSSWLLTHESLTAYLKGIEDREQKCLQLLTLHNKIPDAKNKRFVLQSIERIVEEWAERVDARGNAEPTFVTLKVLGTLRQLLSTAEMPDSKREKLTNQLQTIYTSANKKLNIINKIAQDVKSSAVDKGVLLIDLLKAKALLSPDDTKAKSLLKTYMKDPAFLNSYMALSGTDPTLQKKNLMELMQLVQ